jgi:hypothetical protein
MSNASFYVTWSTWSEQQVTTPWDFWFLKAGTTLKPREGHADHVSPDQIAQAYLTGDAPIIQLIEQNYVTDVVLATFVTAPDSESAQLEVKHMFPDAVIDKCVWVDAETQTQIINLFDQTVNQVRYRAPV